MDHILVTHNDFGITKSAFTEKQEAGYYLLFLLIRFIGLGITAQHLRGVRFRGMYSMYRQTVDTAFPQRQLRQIVIVPKNDCLVLLVLKKLKPMHEKNLKLYIYYLFTASYI